MPTDDSKLDKAMQAASSSGSRRPPFREPSPPPRFKVPPEVQDDFGTRLVDGVETKIETALNLGFLGTGQGGARIAQSFWNLGYRHVGAFNTTDTDFKGLAAEMPKLSLDIGGAGKDMRMANDALGRHELDAHDLLTSAWGDHLDCALICVSLGGGTGSGTAARFVQLARQYLEGKNRPQRVGAIVSLPSAESQMVSRNAVAAFRSLVEVKASPIVIIDNTRINEIYRDAAGNKHGIAKLYPLANDTVARLLHTFNIQAAIHSDITLDKSELTQLLDGGIVVMGEARIDVEHITGPADVSTAIRDELTRNVMASVDLTKGKLAGCLFIGHKDVLDTFPLDYFEAGFGQLDRIVGSASRGGEPTVVHRGVYESDDPGLRCYTMVSALEPPHARLAELARKGGLDVKNTPGLAAFLGV